VFRNIQPIAVQDDPTKKLHDGEGAEVVADHVRD
jgi:hypothetical protein